MNKIDKTQPMELEDGTPVTDLKHPYPEYMFSRYVFVQVAGGERAEYDLTSGENRYKGSSIGDLEPRKLRNVTAIDWNAPLELSDGTPVLTARSCAGGYAVRISSYGGGRTFTAEGKAKLPDRRGLNWMVEGRTVRNRAIATTPSETPMFTSKSLVTTRDGRFARILSTESKAYPNRPIIVERKTHGNELTIQAYYPDGRALRSGQTAEDIVLDVPAVSTFFNVYSDGSTGKTVHKSFETAKVASKVGKTRIGIMELTNKGELPVGVKLLACQPSTRTTGYSAASWTPLA